jgi:hypothetical protein
MTLQPSNPRDWLSVSAHHYVLAGSRFVDEPRKSKRRLADS